MGGVDAAERREFVRGHRAAVFGYEQRVMLRVTPYLTFQSPPRHVYTPDDVKGLTHDLGTSLPW
jgi:hypothetical protein